MKNRTGVDFSKHQFIVNESDDISTYRLKHPDYEHMDSILFINTNGILAVTGDYGNWIFCRQFHPSEEGYVSDMYWVEKLHIASSQNGLEFDSELTEEEIKREIKEVEEEWEDGSRKEEYLEWLKEECLAYVDCGEHEYSYHAYYNMPAEYVPFIRKPKIWLQILFDAFEEMCRRMKNNQ